MLTKVLTWPGNYSESSTSVSISLLGRAVTSHLSVFSPPSPRTFAVKLCHTVADTVLLKSPFSMIWSSSLFYLGRFIFSILWARLSTFPLYLTSSLDWKTSSPSGNKHVDMSKLLRSIYSQAEMCILNRVSGSCLSFKGLLQRKKVQYLKMWKITLLLEHPVRGRHAWLLIGGGWVKAMEIFAYS